MPHEKVKFYGDVWADQNNLVVSWNRNRLGMGWVQVAVIPPGWKDTDDWHLVDMSVGDIERTIKLLKKAKKQLQEEVDYKAIAEGKIGMKVKVVNYGKEWEGRINSGNKDTAKVSSGFWTADVPWDNLEFMPRKPIA